MGVIPDDVVRGVRRAPHAPTVMKSDRALTDAVGLRSLPAKGDIEDALTANRNGHGRL